MTKTGVFDKLDTGDSAGEASAANGAATSAVNKVLGILDLIIRKTVNFELGKVKDAIKKITYSETAGNNVPESGSIQTTANSK